MRTSKEREDGGGDSERRRLERAGTTGPGRGGGAEEALRAFTLRGIGAGAGGRGRGGGLSGTGDGLLGGGGGLVGWGPPRRCVGSCGAPAPRRNALLPESCRRLALPRGAPERLADGERPPRRGKGRSERRAARADGVDGVTCSRICSLQALPSAAQSRLARRRESRRDAGRGGWAWARARAASVPVLTGRWNWGPWQSRSELLLNTYVPYKRLWMHCSDTNAWAGAESLMS